MTPQDLIAAFDTFAEAPDGLRRLREVVLQLATRGLLVSQSPEDEPATVLFDGRGSDQLDDAPFDLPHGWVWTDISRLGEVLGGATPSKRNSAFWGGNVPWVSPKDMKRDFIGESRDYITEAAVEGSSVKRIPSNSVLMVVRGMILAHSFPTALTTAEVTINQDMKALLPFDLRLAPYLLMASKGHKQDALDLVERSTHGTCKLPTKSLFAMPIAVPPLAEQKRIVARVDELMGLLDRLEAARNAREATRTALRDAALAALRDADTPDEVEVAWERIAGRMDDLFTDPADVGPLRQTVLQLAVRGRLVPQDPADEPASVLLERIAVEKARLVKEKKIRKPKVLPPVSEDEQHYLVGGHWSWARMDTVCTHIVDCLHRTPKYVDEGIPAIRTADVVPGRLLVEKARRVSDSTYMEQIRRLAPRTGDILYSREGERLGIAAQVPEGVKCCLSQRMAHLRPSSLLAAEFVMWFMNSPSGYGAAVGVVNQTTSPHVNMASIRAMVVPLPPVAEQERIVAVVNELMGLLDQLEEHLAAKTATHDAFAAAAVHHLDAR